MTETASFQGKANIYVCEVCRGHIVTRDRDNGTTPFMITCHATTSCKGMMKSSFYRVFDQDVREDYEWYRPSAVEVVPAQHRHHVSMGGLLLRKVGGVAIDKPATTSVELKIKVDDLRAALRSEIEDVLADAGAALHDAAYTHGFCDGRWDGEGLYDPEELKRGIDDIARLESYYDGLKDDYVSKVVAGLLAEPKPEDGLSGAEA